MICLLGDIVKNLTTSLRIVVAPFSQQLTNFLRLIVLIQFFLHPLQLKNKYYINKLKKIKNAFCL